MLSARILLFIMHIYYKMRIPYFEHYIRIIFYCYIFHSICRRNAKIPYAASRYQLLWPRHKNAMETDVTQEAAETDYESARHACLLFDFDIALILLLSRYEMPSISSPFAWPANSDFCLPSSLFTPRPLCRILARHRHHRQAYFLPPSPRRLASFR